MKYRLFENSKWVDIHFNCPRCSEPLLREVLNTGEPLRRFTCRRYGCTWPDYDESVEFILSKLGEVK